MSHDHTKLFLIIDSNLKIVLLNDVSILYAEEHILENDIIDGIIFNFTKIEKLIADFINKYKLKQIPTTILLKDHLIIHALSRKLNLDPKTYLLKTYELQFYPESIVYSVGIKYYQIFQYSLLCSKLPLKLTSITTSILDLHQLFKTYTHKQIKPLIISTEELKAFLKNGICDYQLKPICNEPKDFDSILSIY